MGKRWMVLGLLGLLTAAGAARAEGPAAVAVLDIEAKGLQLPPQVLDSLGDYLATSLAQGPTALPVLSRDELHQRLRADPEAAAALTKGPVAAGRKLGLPRVLSTRVHRLGKSCVVTTNLFDTASGVALRAAMARAGCDHEALSRSLEIVAAQVQVAEGPPPPATRTQEAAQPPEPGETLAQVIERAQLVQEPLRISGPAPAEILERYVRERRNELRLCYAAALAEEPKLTGKVVVEFVLEPSGRIARARAAMSTMNRPEVEACLVQRVLAWRLPRSEAREPATVSLPLMFTVP